MYVCMYLSIYACIYACMYDFKLVILHGHIKGVCLIIFLLQNLITSGITRSPYDFDEHEIQYFG